MEPAEFADREVRPIAGERGFACKAITPGGAGATGACWLRYDNVVIVVCRCEPREGRIPAGIRYIRLRPAQARSLNVVEAR
jgi:hypothetical protein